MKKIIFALIATLMSFNSMAEVTYQVIPLPQSIKLDPSGKSAQLIKGQVVSYPSDNAMMKRNAQFAQEFLGLTPQAAAKKVKTPVNLTLGLQSENPDAYQITIDKKGITIQGASESGVFYGIVSNIVARCSIAHVISSPLPSSRNSSISLPCME